MATIPFSKRSAVYTRVANFETEELKVNDADGNPINIASIIVWHVEDTAKAAYTVADYGSFVRTQAEAALRHITMGYSYDGKEGERSLRVSTEDINKELAQEVGERVALAGVKIDEARISKLAYAPEIAQAMLQRQQAGAIVAARELIVEGAVSMVETALERIERDDFVELDEEKKATMVSNLLVVLCGDSKVNPVINAGSLY